MDLAVFSLIHIKATMLIRRTGLYCMSIYQNLMPVTLDAILLCG